MRRELDGKVALVTGGGRNVGSVIARRLAADGALVVINHFRSPEAARETRLAIEAAGGRAHVIRASVAIEAQRERMFDEIQREFGGLDILVNNAANGGLVPSPEVTEQLIDKAVNTNYKGSLGCAQLASRLMAERGGGSIINISTLGGGQFVMANYLACGPAKAAVEALTRYLAADYASLNIRVNTAAAGMLESEVAGLFPDAAAMQRAIIEATPLGRLGRPEELAEVVAFLASGRSSWITGQVILADGGLATGSALLSPRAADAAAPKPPPTPAAVSGSAPVAAVPPAAARPISALSSAQDCPVDAVDDDIAIVGMGIAVPGASDPAEFWNELLHGADRFVDIPADRWDNDMFWSADKSDEDKTYSKKSAFITEFRPHPALAAELGRDGGDPAEVELTTMWLRHSLLQALDGVKRRPEDRFSFVVGYTADGSQHLEEATVVAGTLARLDPVLHELELPAAERASIRSRISDSLQRRYPRSGPDPLRFFPHQVGLQAMNGILPARTELLLVDTACSSSLYAIDLGLKGLLEGRHDVAICGGSFAVGPRGSILFAKLNGLSVSGEVRSLDTASDGVLFSDGAATVVLKRLSRAREDGDRVLATIKSFGSSSDGKGKAIYAPSATGQKLAIGRALNTTEMGQVRPEWIVAHATGTPAGDLAEFTTLRETFGVDESVFVTSNKSVIGHTGWAAGAASLIEVVLGFENELIPPQHRFTAPPADFLIDSTRLTIPTEAVAWPKRDHERRTASVSGFGFGGTNAHLIVQEPPDPDAPVRAGDPGRPGGPGFGADERIVIVAQAMHVSGSDATDDPGLLFAGGEPSFGDTYPMPSLQQVRMPPGVMRSIDRCQLMILQCAHTLRNRLGSFWEEHQALTGVVLGHLGATRNATLYATRCYLDDLTAALRSDPAIAAEPWLPETLDRLKADVRRLVPASNEDSFPGMMPNVIPARVANYFDLNGLNMTVDTGFTSTLSAIDVASRYLRQGELSMALVGGINGNSTDEVRALLGSALDDDTVLAEGAFLFALVTERTALAAGLPVLGYLGTPTIVPERARLDEGPSIECGALRTGRDTCYLGADGAVGVLQALTLAAGGQETLVVCRGEAGAPDVTLRVSGPGGPRSDGERDRETGEARPERLMPAQFQDERRFGEAHPLQVSRHVAALTPAPAGAGPTRDRTPFWPAEPTVVLTDQPALLHGQPIPAGTLVLSTRPPVAGAGEPANLRHLSELTVDAVKSALDGHDPGHRLTHVRVITDLGLVDGTTAPQAEGIPALHELVFLVLQQRHQALTDAAGASCIGLLLRAVGDGAPHPLAGLFSGLFKVVHLEFPSCLSFALVTSESTVPAGSAQAEAESALARGLPVAYYQSGVRQVMTVDEEPGELVPAGAAQLGPDSVVLAIGGGRGITAELLTEVARHFQPTIFVFGSNRLDSHPAHLLAMNDAEFGSARKAFILQQRDRHPGRTTAWINRDFERARDARATRSNLTRMAAHSGADRVRYIACDVTDPDQVLAAVNEVLGAAAKIDLLINAAGLNRSAPIASKDVAEFRLIRDLKLDGYYNLKAALRGRAPRAWCNFGSLLGLTGQVGEVDYASANDFLATAAMYGHQELGENEFTVGWTLWGEVGLGANSLTKSYFEKSGLYSNMTTAEGVHHFIRELNVVKSSPSVVYLGTAERTAVDRLLPGFLSSAPSPPPGPGLTVELAPPGPVTADFYLGKVLSRSDSAVEFARTFDLATDSYLGHHLVRGVATLPGTFVTEIALEAATALLPDLQVYALEDLTFRHFLKVRPNTPVHARIHAELVERRPDLGQAQVHVRVTSDVVAPNGRVLVKDKLHFEVRVLLGWQLPAPPSWEPWYPADETPIEDPYHHPASPVLLSGMFVSTTGTRLHPLGKRATYNLALPVDEPTFSRFALPTILLDGLARTGVLTLVDGDLIPLAAPLGIGRIDFYEHASDAEVAARYDAVDLCVMVPDPDARGARPGPGNRFVAVRPDGRMLLQMKNLDWTLMGYLDRRTNAFLTPEHAGRRLATGPKPTPPEPAPPNSQEVNGGKS